MQVTEIFRTFSTYNQWINQSLLEACYKLSDEDRKRDTGAPFRSIHGIWNHLLLTDRGWLARFAGEPFPYPSLALILYDDFEELRAERAKTDAEIEAFVASLTPERLGESLTFTLMSRPQQVSLTFYIGAMQLFNHQTHHRGQITALLEQLGGDCGVTDLGAMARLPTK
ncbi:DUF664 domain-containing protein [bacterium]|nr:MAG: DUF664 domain-containing protein [bacterium]